MPGSTRALSLRKFAIVLWSGVKRRSNHITSTLRSVSRSNFRLDLTSFTYP